MPEKTSVFITNSDIKQRSFMENDLAWAFLTKTPINPGHTLVSPRRIVSSMYELTKDELLAIFDLAKQARLRLQEVLGAEGFNYA